VAKGIQFLHGGIIPGLFGNNLKISNVLLDQNLVAKISSYNLPIIELSTQMEVILSFSITTNEYIIEHVPVFYCLS
jgi:hypothetical protein